MVHFELCRDCELGCFSELLLADIRRLLVMAVVFLYQITVFLQQNITASLLERHFNDSMQKLCTRAAAAAVAVNRQVADGADVVFTDTGHTSTALI